MFVCIEVQTIFRANSIQSTILFLRSLFPLSNERHPTVNGHAELNFNDQNVLSLQPEVSTEIYPGTNDFLQANEPECENLRNAEKRKNILSPPDLIEPEFDRELCI